MSKRVIPDEAKQLRKVKSLIKDPDDWCQKNYYRTDAKGKTRHCAIGAVRAAWAMNRNFGNFEVLLHQAAVALFDKSIVDVNDNLGHAEVMKCFDYAINKLIEDANRQPELSNEF